MTYRIGSAVAAAVLVVGTTASASTFDVDLRFADAGLEINLNGEGAATTQAFSARQIELFGMAETFWETVITGYQSLAAPTVKITAFLAPVLPENSFGDTLAFAGPFMNSLETVVSGGKSLVRATHGIVQFDSNDFGATASKTRSDQEFLEVAIHEMAHVFGFGTLFDANGLVNAATSDSGPRYTGAQGLAAYNDALPDGTGPVTSILLDDLGGHWNECFVLDVTSPSTCSDDPTDGDSFVNDPELLTTFAAFGSGSLSPITVAALRDLGFVTASQDTFDVPNASPAAPVPLPAGGWLLLAGLVGLRSLPSLRRVR